MRLHQMRRQLIPRLDVTVSEYRDLIKGKLSYDGGYQLTIEA